MFGPKGYSLWCGGLVIGKHTHPGQLQKETHVVAAQAYYKKASVVEADATAFFCSPPEGSKQLIFGTLKCLLGCWFRSRSPFLLLPSMIGFSSNNAN